MTTNVRIDKLLANLLPVVGLAWATRRPRLVIVPPAPPRDVEVIAAADALALAWAAHRP